jgi:hypothetical protein
MMNMNGTQPQPLVLLGMAILLLLFPPLALHIAEAQRNNPEE